MKLADLPFPQRDPLELFGLERTVEDDDFIAFGWCRPESLTLVAARGPSFQLKTPLVVAVHTADEPSTQTELELEFWVDLDDEEAAVLATLPDFYQAHLMPLLGEETAVVLALCNPAGLEIVPPAGLGARRFYACHGEARAWLVDGQLQLHADRWMSHPQEPMTDRWTYVGLFVLKLMDIAESEGGMTIPLALPPELVPLRPAIDRLYAEGLITQSRWRGRWQITKLGLDVLGRTIDEAQGYIAEFDDLEVDEMINVLHESGLDPMRVRFLWGWVEGEFDDLVYEPGWAESLAEGAFFDDLEAELRRNQTP